MSDDGVSDQIDEYARVRLDYAPASGQKGAGEKNHDHDAPTDSDGSGQATTTFNPNEGTHPTDDIEYSKLAKINDGLFKHDGEKHNRHVAMVSDTKFYADKLGLTEHTKRRAVGLMKCIDDGTKFRDLDSAMLAAITLACNQQDRWLQQEDQYKTIRDGLNITESHVRTARETFRNMDTTGKLH